MNFANKGSRECSWRRKLHPKPYPCSLEPTAHSQPVRGWVDE